MYRLLLLLTTIPFLGFASTLPCEVAEPAFSHLLEVNQEWRHFSDGNPDFSAGIQFSNEDQRIRFHLLQVCDLLDSGKELLEAEVAARRSALIHQLRAYAEAMVFPKNRDYSVRRPCFIDADGNACAVGYLMLHNGFAAEAHYVSEHMNYAYVKEIPRSLLEEWVAASGLSAEEMALIQPGYPPEQTWINAGQGIDGDINAIIPQSNYLVVAGDFNFNGVDANVARYNGSEMSAFPATIDGVVYELVQHEGKMWACGSFQAGFADHARWNAGNWEYQSAFMSKYGEAYTMFVFNNTLYLSGSSSGFAGQDYFVVRRNADNDFTVVGEFDAPVRALGVYNGQLVAGGELSNLIEDGNEVACSHVAIMNGDNDWQQLGNGLPSPVRCLLLQNDNLYAGGDFYNADASDGFALARWNSGNEWLLDASLTWFLEEQTARMNAIFFWQEEDKLLCGGDYASADIFEIGGDMGEMLPGTEGEVVGVDSWTYPMTGDIRDIAVWGGDLYISGGFSFDNNALSDLAKLDELGNIPSPEVPQLQIWPNPAQSALHLDSRSVQAGDELKLFDSKGRLVATLPVTGAMVDLGFLAEGHYRLQLWNRGELRSQAAVVIAR